MAQKRFDEYFAKVVLEKCFPEKFADLQIVDKPDLWCGTKIGIEVTNCIPTRVAEAFNLWHKVEKYGDNISPRIWERLEQLDEVQFNDKDLLWFQGSYANHLDDSPINEFLDAVAKKVERLNSKNADYEKMEEYELFVNSFILIPHWLANDVIVRLQEVNNKPKKFTQIYLITNERKLLVFNTVNGTLAVKCLYTYLDRMAEYARMIFLGEEK